MKIILLDRPNNYVGYLVLIARMSKFFAVLLLMFEHLTQLFW